ncbi:substrate-binding domain-containing protein [Actinoplanes sp. NPDC049118]|uniref:substrate-binding domain-containing protein n=1 Tax=Actinoplanes sp. NPDC049118 TaxID=3155769 RepID=UPI0033CE15F4
MRFRAATAALTTVAVVAVVAGVRLGISGLSGAECSGEVRLAVAAAPDVAPAVRAEAEAWTSEKAEVDGVCVRIDVEAADPADVTALLSTKQRAALTGAGRTGVNVPDVWISDSGTWLQRLRSAAPSLAFTEEGSIALSPVVIAMPEPTAEKLGWPRRQPAYADLLNLITTSTTTRTGTVDPARDAAALSGLLALGAAANAADQRRPGTTNGLLRALATDTSVLRDDLMAQLPQADDAASLAAGLSLAAMSESDVVRFNDSRPPVPLAALYLEPSPVPLDHPFAVMPELSTDQAEAAHQFYGRLTADGDFRGRLAQAGFRAPDGSSPAGFDAPEGAPDRIETGAAEDSGTAAASEADGATIDRALAGWSAVVAPARILAIVDASDSMRTPVPEARNATRMGLTLAAARGGLGLFSDDWSVGLWASAGGPGGGRRELVGIRALTSNRGAVAAALGGIEPAGGEAGLYRTILDGYRAVQNGWQAGRVNSVLVLTDGVGIGAGDLALRDLLGQLEEVKVPDRPVQVIVLGIGGAVDRPPLEQITEVTGGGVFVAEDPAQIGAVFLDALSLRTTAPR